MGYEKQNIDFIKRTKSIIEQYDKFVMPKVGKKEQFEVTLFINCFVGLLIVPQQNWFDDIPEELISSDEWGIEPECIPVIKDKSGHHDEEKNIKNIARHLRNSIAHYHFKGLTLEHENNQITNIEFKDFTNNKTCKTFEAIIPVTALKKFINKFIDTLLKIII
jgi:hypothetical protein